MSTLWNVGVNQAADAIVVSKDQFVLLIKRGDNGLWAFPGGFFDAADVTTAYTATREAEEEAGIFLENPGILIYSGKVDDSRNEDDRWVETDAYLHLLEQNAADIPLTGGDDAIDAMWADLRWEAELVIQPTHEPILRSLLDWTY